MKNKTKIVSAVLVLIIAATCVLALTSCTRKIDQETFYERATEAVNDYDSRHGRRNGAVIIEDERYEFLATRDINDKWTITYDENLPEEQVIALKALTSSLLTTRADDWAALSKGSDEISYGLFVGIEKMELVKGFEFKNGDLYLKFDEYGFLTEYRNGESALMLVEWWLE